MTFTFFELLHTFSRTLSTTDTQQPSQRSIDAIADRSPRRSRRVIADKSTTRQTPPTCRRPKRFVGLVWSGRVRVVEFRNDTSSSKVWPGRLYRPTANTTDFVGEPGLRPTMSGQACLVYFGHKQTCNYLRDRSVRPPLIAPIIAPTVASCKQTCDGLRRRLRRRSLRRLHRVSVPLLRP